MQKHDGLMGRILVVVLSVAMIATSIPTPALASIRDAATTAAQSMPTVSDKTDKTTDQSDNAQVVSTTQDSSADSSQASSAATDDEQTPSATTGDASQTGSVDDSQATSPVADTLDLTLSLNHSYLTYQGQTVALPATSVTVPTASAFSFSVTADEGYEVSAVKTTLAGVETTLEAQADGTYQIPAASLVEGTELVIETTALAADTATADATPIAQTEEAAVMSLSAAAASGYTVQAGGTVSIDGTSGYRYNYWTTSNWSVASVDNENSHYAGYNSSSATVTGIAAGTATITHYYRDNWRDSYSSESWTVTVTAAATTVTFDANGGSAAAPDAQSVANKGEEITLPDYTGTRDGYTFAGWATTSNVVSSTYYPIYAAGSDYTVTADTTLYAVWTQSAGATFYIRTDGTTPDEPGQFSSAGYSSGIDIANALKSNVWVVDVTGVKVAENLANMPTDDQIKSVFSSYDPTTQYVKWYVIKSATGSQYSWHVDGVVIDRNKAQLNYDTNRPAGSTSLSGGMPLGSQFVEGSEVYVGHDGGNSGTLTTPTLEGYTFIGWNTQSDGRGTSYASDATFTIEADTTLYAQWKANDSTDYKVKRYTTDGTLIDSATRSAATDSSVTVKNADKSITGYTYAGDSYEGTVTTGTVAGDGSLVLKLYFSPKAVTLNFHNSSSGTDIASQTGVYGDTFAAGTSQDIDLEAAKVFIKNGKYDIAAEKVDAAQSLSDLEALGFTFTFDGWCTGAHNGGTMVVEGSDMSNLGIQYKNTDTLTIFSGSTADVYAHYAISCTPHEKVTLTANSSSVTYNGQEQSVTGYTGLPEGKTFSDDQLDKISASASGTNVGSYPSNFAAGAPKTITATDGTVYDVTYKPGTLTITAISTQPITITAGTASKTYDGTPLTDAGYTYTDNVLADGDVLTVVVGGSQTNAGSSANTVTSYKVMRGDVDVTAGYSFATSIDGTLTVSKRAVTLTSATDSKTYDGSALTNSGVTVTGDGWATGEGVDTTFTGTQTDAGSSKNTFMYAAKKGTDLNNYQITQVTGTLTVSKRAVTLTSATDSKTYDGSALTNSGVTVTGDGWAKGEGASYSFTGSQTNVGSSDNTFTYALLEGTKAANYDISTAAGTLTVNPAGTLTVNGFDATKVYDGKALSTTAQATPSNGTTVEYSTDNGSTWTTGVPSITNVGKLSVQVRASNSNYTAADGQKYATASYTLEVTPLAVNVTITGNNSTVTYDGKAHTVEGYTTSTADGLTVALASGKTAKATRTDAGKTTMGLTAGSFSVTADANHTVGTVTVVDGYQMVTSISTPLTVTANSGSKTYDGSDLTDAGWSVTNGVLLNGDTVVATVTGKQTNVGSSTNAVTSFKIMRGDADVTSDYSSVSLVAGTLTVTPKAVTVTAEAAYKAFGTADPAFTAKVDGTVNGDTIVYSVTRPNAGIDEAVGIYTGAVVAAGDATQGNYTVTYAPADFTITTNTTDLGLTAENGGGVYNGSVYTLTNVAATGAAADGATIEYKVGDGEWTTTAPSATDVKGSLSNISVRVSKTGYKTVQIDDLSITVTPAQVTLKSADLSKAYDGSALTNGGTSLTTETGFVSGQGVTCSFTGSQTLVGSSANAFTYKANDGTNLDNYTISKTEGTLTVTNRDAKYQVTLEANSATATYDGSEHSAKGVKTDTFVEGGQTYKVSGFTTSDPTQTNAGTYANAITGIYKVTDASGNDVTSQFSVSTTNGTLTIDKAKVTLVSADLTKAYDGSALTNGGKALTTETGFVAGQGVTCSFTGSQTLVGSSANAFTYKANEGTDLDNYDISKTEGTLTVTNRTEKYVIDATAPDGSYTYDGTAKTAEGVSYQTLTFDGITYTVEGLSSSTTQTDAGTYATSITGTAKVYDAAHNDVTAQFTVNTSDAGTLVIAPATLTVTTPTASKAYDGTALTADGAISGFVAGETATFSTTGSQTYVGSSTNTYAIDWNGTANKDNYTITENLGTLTVTTNATAVTLTAPSDTKTYDGSALTRTTGTTQTGLPKGLTFEATVAGSQTDAGSSDNLVTGYVIRDAAGTDVTNSFTNVQKVAGKLTVDPVAISVKAADATKPYDGTPLTDSGWTVSSGKFVGADGLATVDVEGTQTFVGSSANVVKDYTLASGTKAGNYTITKVDGTLSVTNEHPIAITVTAAGASKTYDGTALTDDSATLTAGTLATGDTLVATATGSVTNVTDSAEGNNTVNTVRITHDGVDVTDNYAITKVAGSLTITPAALTVTTPTDSKVYDGTALTAAGTLSGLVNGETATFSTTGTQTEVGSSTNGYDINWDGSAKASNYSITESLGTLKVDPADISGTGFVVSQPTDVVYDGLEQRQSVTVTDSTTSKALVGGTDYTVSYSSDVTNVGTVTATVTGIGNYAGKVDRTYKITPAPLTVTTPTDSKVYDGDALTAAGSLSGLVNGETATFSTTGTQTEVGSSTNTYSLVWDGSAKASNYSITESLGTLTVSAAVIPTPVNPTPTPTNPTPIDTVATALQNGYQIAVGEDPTPLVSAETVDENGTPLASSEQATCWVHWYMIIGILCTSLYAGVVLLRRRRYTKGLKNREDHILGDDDQTDDQTQGSVATNVPAGNEA